MKVKSVLFVCSANCCRSVIAEALFKEAIAKRGLKDVETFSRGTHAMFGRLPFAGVIDALKDWKLDVSAHQARPLERNDIARADLILVAEDSHLRFIGENFLKAAKKTFLLKQYAGDAPDPTGYWNVADPMGLTPEACRQCRDDLQKTIENLIAKLWPTEGSPK